MAPWNRPSIRVLTGSISVAFDTWLPFASGTLISYAKKHLDKNSFHFHEPLFKTLPESELNERFARTDVLALTCYVWNEDINAEYTRKFKSIRPQGLVIWGGPNIPKEPAAFSIFVENYPEVDSFVVGPGEQAFVDLLSAIEKDGPEFDTAPWPLRLEAANPLLPTDIETNAYLDGTFDSIFKNQKNLKASFETNRGCPYSCSFCDWGGQSQSRITRLPDNVTDRTIDFLFSKKNLKEIEILDANFGMFKKDLETVEKMIEAKSKYKTDPHISYSGLAKNGSKYLPLVLKKFHENFNMTDWQLKVSFQTHSIEVLKTAKRENIKTEKLIELLEFGKSLNIRVCSEMIIGLPGETAKSWCRTLEKDIELGINLTRAYILTVSENTAIAEPSYRAANKILSKKVIFPDFRVHYQDDEAQAVGKQRHNVVYSCSSYDLNELCEMYKYWWFHHTFYNGKLIPSTLQSLISSEFCYDQIIDQFINSRPEHSIFIDLVAAVVDFVKVYFKPEPETYIDDYNLYRFASGAMRFSDIYNILLHQEECKKEIFNFFQNHYPEAPYLLETLKQDLNCWDESIKAPIPSHLRGLAANIRGKNVARTV